jgi:hypothetical protein
MRRLGSTPLMRRPSSANLSLWFLAASDTHRPWRQRYAERPNILAAWLFETIGSFKQTWFEM